MTGAGRLRRVRRTAAIAVAAAVLTTLGAAAAATLRARAGEGWAEAGLWRLLALDAWQRFDRWLPVALAVALAGGLLVRRPPPRRLALAATALVASVAALRLLTAVDGWLPGAPNVLLVSIDTLRADHLGAYGSPLPTSPTIDARLAGAGVLFEDAWSQSPKTTPSHMTLLTSLYPCVHGVGLWTADEPARVLAPRAHTLAELLRNAGYATAAFTGGAQMDRTRGFDQGFEVYEDDGGQLGRALRWIKRHRRRRWFVFYHTYAVHDPYVPPPNLVERFGEGYAGPVRDAVERLRAAGGAWDDRHRTFWGSVDRDDPTAVRFVARLYAAGVRAMDDRTMAPLLDRLDELDLTRRTLVVFTSDHGEALGEDGRFLHDDLHAPTLHVPLVLRLPGVLPAGRRVAARARLIDVLPTILELVGVTPPPGLQGRSLVPFVGGERRDAGEAIAEWSTRGRVYESLRQGALAYIVDRDRERLLEDERVDVLAARPDAAAPLRQALDRWRTECRSRAVRFASADTAAAPDPLTLRQLRALGYVQ